MNTRRRALAAGAAATLLLAGCAVAPPATRPDDLISGRLAVRVEGQPQRSVSAAFELSGSAQAGQLVLTTPLGTTAAQARWQPGSAWLQAGGSSQRFDTLEALVTEVLGEAIPLAALFDWLRGRPWPDAPAAALANGGSGFLQLGWQVDLAQWLDAGAVLATRQAAPVVTVRARIDR